MHTMPLCSMSALGELIKTRRLARKWSLRKFGKQVGVTPAYVADIEAGRRLPSADLQEKISLVLEIPLNELAAVDSRLTADLRDWIEEQPELTALLRSLRSLPESDTLIRRLSRFISRRFEPQIPRGSLVIWESELRTIAAEASAWSIETGGDLFGRWHDVPTVLLATKAGPAAQRDHAHFRLDVAYLRQLSEVMATDWVLRYFGDWHSHHRLGLSSPSGGDRKRIFSIGGRNQFPNMAEIIVTLDDEGGDGIIRIHPWIYDLSKEGKAPLPLGVKVLPGLSPVRQVLIARKMLPEQDLHGWEKVSLNRTRVGSEAGPPAMEAASDIDSATRERTLAQLAEALQNASGNPVEQHTTGFGCVLVVELKEPQYLAFALGSAWPMRILEIHRLNRANGSTEARGAPADLIAPDIAGVLEVLKAEQSSMRGVPYVER
jgi:transcriptional regulator with XRE-family HTH domain